MGRLSILPNASGRSTRFSNPPPRRKHDMFWRPSFDFSERFLLRSLHLGGHRTDSTLALTGTSFVVVRMGKDP